MCLFYRYPRTEASGAGNHRLIAALTPQSATKIVAPPDPMLMKRKHLTESDNEIYAKQIEISDERLPHIFTSPSPCHPCPWAEFRYVRH